MQRRFASRRVNDARYAWLPILVALFLSGCGPSASDSSTEESMQRPASSAESTDVESATSDESASAVGGVNTSNEEDVARRGMSKAMKAKKALFERLSSRLVEVMSTSGPVEAIEVCSQEARVIADEVGKEQGVRIGRTSFRQRNSKNVPPAWAKEFVEQQVSEVKSLTLEDGATGALMPIVLQPQCTVCHGNQEQIPAGVQEKLAELYPDDQATGFAPGDLRGYFWVEVPAS